MATDKFLPTLGPDGWMDNPQSLLERVFSYYVTSDRKQTSMFHEYSKTMQDALMVHKEPIDVKNQVVKDLNELLSYHFDGNIQVDVNELPENPDTHEKLRNIVKYTIDIKVVLDETETIQLSRVLETTGSRILNYQDLIYRIYNFHEEGKSK